MALPIVKRLRRRLRESVSELAGREAFSLAAEIPGLTPEQPLWRLKIEMLSEEQADGGRLRLRAHLQAHVASVLGAPAPSAQAGLPAPESSRAALPARLVGEWLRRGLAVAPVRRLAAPLLRHDFNSWFELRASTADLLAGARALLPESERLRALGIDTAMAGDGPLAQTWSGATGGSHPGFAQVSLLQVDKRHLPKAVAALLGTRPFQLVAAVVNVVEQKPAAK